MTNALFPFLLEPLGTGGIVVIAPGLVDVEIEEAVGVSVDAEALTAEIVSTLSVVILENAVGVEVSDPLTVAVETINVDVGIC